MTKLRTAIVDQLFDVILSLDDREECYRFFEDVCTVNEIQDMAQRFEVAQLLAEGKNYQQIAAQVGVSTATISRVSRCLNYGNGGYEEAIAKRKAATKDE